MKLVFRWKLFRDESQNLSSLNNAVTKEFSSNW